MKFELTLKQKAANNLLASDATHIMLYGGARCVAGDTVLDGHTATIREMAEAAKPVVVLTSHGEQMAEPPFWKGRCSLLTVLTATGREVSVTPDHRFWNGQAWVYANDLAAGDMVAVRTYSQNPDRSSLELGPQASPSDARHCSERREDCRGDCSCGSRQCGPLPHSAGDCGLTCRASRSDVLAHNRQSQRQSVRVSQWLGLGNHKARLLERGKGHIRSGLELFRRAMMDGFPLSGRLVGSSAHDGARIFAPSLRQRQDTFQFAGRFAPVQSSARQVDIDAGQCCARDNSPYDTPSELGYSMDTIVSITRTAVQDFYTLHVPVTEQYFANGILHHNSGKTFTLLRAIVARALIAPKSRHAVLRYRFNHVKASVVYDTLPKVLGLCFPGVAELSKLDKTDWFYRFPNGSEIWFGGLDEKERAEKILGQEYSTLFLNECSQIPWASRNIAVTRLAQKITTDAGNELRLKCYYDCNPPGSAHWTYRLFTEKRDPDRKTYVPNPENYAAILINPKDNEANLPTTTLTELQNLPEAQRRRFWLGQFADMSESALWSPELLDQQRILDGKIPEFVRIVIAVDPSGVAGEEDKRSDEVGIVVCALGKDGRGYVLEDLSGRMAPAAWGKAVASAFERHDADCVVAEENYGGAMVAEIIRAARPGTPYRAVKASRGKIVRAEPIAALFEQQKISLVGRFDELEDQLMAMTTAGYLGSRSPDRADAMIWGLASLFPAMTKREDSTAWRPPVVSVGYASMKKRRK